MRDLGGLIVIDFIDMMEKKNVAEVEKAFKKALSLDRARIQLSRISKFGLLELSRQKKQPTIQEISYTICPYCSGSGFRPSLEYAALSAFRKIESEAVKGTYSDLRVILPHEIANYILNQKKAELLKMEATFGLALHICGSGEMLWDKMEMQYTIKEKELTEPASQEEAAPEAPVEAPAEIPAQETPAAGETPAGKKRRRRPRRRKSSDPKPESGTLDDPSKAVAVSEITDHPESPLPGNSEPEVPAPSDVNKEEGRSPGNAPAEALPATVAEAAESKPLVITPAEPQTTEIPQPESSEPVVPKAVRSTRPRFNRKKNHPEKV